MYHTRTSATGERIELIIYLRDLSVGGVHDTKGQVKYLR